MERRRKMSLRCYRANSWIKRAESLPDSDLDGRFIFYWIALNALYGRAKYLPGEGGLGGEEQDVYHFLEQVHQFDREEQSIRQALIPLKENVTRLLTSEFLHKRYWKDGYTDDLDRIVKKARWMAEKAWASGVPEKSLRSVFARLYVLRNQIFHGASTDRSRANRDSLNVAVPVLSKLVHVFWKIVHRHEDRREWGSAPYPPKNSPEHPEDKRQRFNVPHVRARNQNSSFGSTLDELKSEGAGSITSKTPAYRCKPDPTLRFPGGTRPPELHAYPEPVRPVELLFIGWNPPRPFSGFWVSDTRDNLREELYAIFKSLGLITADQPDENFLREFREVRRFYFVHSVKCWTRANYPGFGRNALVKDRRAIGIPLLRACVETHLRPELNELDPKSVCALGELAYEALRYLYPEFDPSVRPTEGRRFDPENGRRRWSLLYTCFPSPAPVGGKSLRLYTREHLERFL